MRDTAEYPAIRTVLAPYDSGHRGLRMGADPNHLWDNGLPDGVHGRLEAHIGDGIEVATNDGGVVDKPAHDPGQGRLFGLSRVLGDEGWLKALRLKVHAPRKLR